MIEDRARDQRLHELLQQYHSSRKNRIIVFVLYKKEAVRVESLLARKGWKVRGCVGGWGFGGWGFGGWGALLPGLSAPAGRTTRKQHIAPAVQERGGAPAGGHRRGGAGAGHSRRRGGVGRLAWVCWACGAAVYAFPQTSLPPSMYVRLQTVFILITNLCIPATCVLLQAVFNYAFPLTTEDYVHRIGRTGRAGKTGGWRACGAEVENASAEVDNASRKAQQRPANQQPPIPPTHLCRPRAHLLCGGQRQAAGGGAHQRAAGGQAEGARGPAQLWHHRRVCTEGYCSGTAAGAARKCTVQPASQRRGPEEGVRAGGAQRCCPHLLRQASPWCGVPVLPRRPALHTLMLCPCPCPAPSASACSEEEGE